MDQEETIVGLRFKKLGLCKARRRGRVMEIEDSQGRLYRKISNFSEEVNANTFKAWRYTVTPGQATYLMNLGDVFEMGFRQVEA